MSDYLWDKSGSDPDVERLEQALRPLAFRGAPPVLPRPRPRAIWWFAACATTAALVVLVWRPWRPQPPAWVDGRAVVAGEWLESGAATLQLGLGALGSVELRPATRARVLGEGHLELDHGSLAAKIDAPPRRFSIETRWARIIDLGCAFQLTVDESGHGRLVVTEGSVAISRDGQEQVVPAGSEQALGEPERPPVLPHVEEEVRPVKPKLVVKTPKIAPQKSPPEKPVAPQKSPAAPPKTPPKSDPSLRLQHDSLKDLERNL